MESGLRVVRKPMTKLINLNNESRVVVDTLGPFLWCLVFGPLYFLAKGNVKHAILSLSAALLTMEISWFIYPFFAPGIIRSMYFDKGYLETQL